MTPTKSRLQQLATRHWKCEYPDKAHHIQGTQGLHVQGLLHGQERDAWLCVISGKVMLWRGPDYAFDDFLKLLDGVLVETEIVPPPAVKPLAGQRGLFDLDTTED